MAGFGRAWFSENANLTNSPIRRFPKSAFDEQAVETKRLASSLGSAVNRRPNVVHYC